jgi:hypothetical protein
VHQLIVNVTLTKKYISTAGLFRWWRSLTAISCNTKAVKSGTSWELEFFWGTSKRRTLSDLGLGHYNTEKKWCEEVLEEEEELNKSFMDRVMDDAQKVEKGVCCRRSGRLAFLRRGELGTRPSCWRIRPWTS